MPDRKIIASLKVQPSSGCDPITQVLTLELDAVGGYSIHERQLRQGRRVSSLRKPLLKEDAETQLSALRGQTIRAYPEDTDVLDGSTYVLTVNAGTSSVTLRWDSVAPDGAQGFETFAEWLASHFPE